MAAPGSPYVCNGCVLCLSQEATVKLADGEVRTAQKTQMYTWVVTASEVTAATKAHATYLRGVCLNPPEPPVGICLSDSGQKHLLYRGAVNHGPNLDMISVTLEGELIRYSPDALRRRLDLCGRLVAASGKPALREPVSLALATSVIRRYSDGQDLLHQWSKVQGEPLSRLAGWLCPNKEECLIEYHSDLAD